MENKKSSFTGNIGFVLAAAGSAVGVGNIWRFPYLAAQNGGGLFLLVYLVLAVTFGFTLLTSDIALGRRTGMSAMNAYSSVKPKWKFLGWITFLVPTIILTYYVVIGGWVSRYMVGYFTGEAAAMASGDFFTGFITSPVAPIVFTLIYLALTAVVVYCGVEKGIEKFSKIVMPALLVIIFGIAVFSLTIKGEDGRTGLDGFLIYIIPNFDGMTVTKFLKVVMDAMGQLFYSLSVSMGIMITYGSYVKKDVNLNKSVNQIEICDTAVAFLAGMMVIPAVFAFQGAEGLTSNGPGLMFVALPQVFAKMGFIGPVIGALFFVMVAFAALTSSVSIMEAVVANAMELFKKSRKQICTYVTVFAVAGAVLVCLGYTFLYFEAVLPNTPVGKNAQILDIADYISNYILMPVVAFCTCIFIGYVAKPKFIIDEMELGGHKFGRKKLYTVMVKYIVPIMILLLFANSFIPAK